MRDMSNMVGVDVDTLREQRNAKLNPPEYEVGQGDDDGWSLSDASSTDFNNSMDNSAFMGTQASDGGLSFNMNSQNMQQQQPMVNTSQEDKFFEGLAVVAKTLYGWGKDLFKGIEEGIKDNDAFYWACYGKKLLVIGCIISVISVVTMFFGMITNYFANSFWGLVGGMILVVMGLIIFSVNFEKGNEIRENFMEKDIFDDNPLDSFEDNNDSFEEEDEDSAWGSWGSDEETEEDGSGAFDVWDNLDSMEEEDKEPENVVYQEDINIDSAIDSIREIPPHTQTRQYLFEEFSRVLPSLNPDFAKLKPISEDSNNFIIFDKILSDAALQVGTREDKLPELQELRENQFIIQIRATRPSGMKEEDIANEIANIYSKDNFGRIIHEGVYATVSSVGGNFIINLFKGENSIVTLADTYREVKDFVLDPQVGKPIVMGVDELGKVWTINADKVFSFIISGKPRSGKSWLAVALLLQLCMYNSPKEVTFEVFDVKDKTSDYFKMSNSIPHFKRFESDRARILSRLRYLTTTEAKRRTKIISDNNCIAIADLKKTHPEVDIPYLYVVIDEIVGLTSKFTKEESAEFRDLMNTLITQMPNLGIKLILVPHRVTNDIVPKTTYVNVGCIACVKSDFDEIKSVMGVTKKDFPYDLSNQGDMALKTGDVNKGKVVFCHGVAITTSNEANEDIYRFIGSLWGMLEPEEKKQEVKEVQEVYKGHNLSGVTNMEDFGEDDDISEDFWDSI